MIKRGDTGAAAVEMALVLPFLLLLLCGIIDFGLAFNARVSLTHAAREGVREYALTQDRSAAEARARQAAPSFPGEAITATADPDPCIFGDEATLTLTAPYQFIFPFVGALVGDTMQAEGVMRCGG